MRPYGSKRSFDTEPRIKSARALVKREGEALIKEQEPPVTETSRCRCGNVPTWFYAPSGGDYCDACVPRGCSCQDDPNEPCCEFNEYT